MTYRDEIAKVASAITNRAIDEGQLIAVGWAAFQEVLIPRDASDAQLHDLRIAYMAGAEHLFASIMHFLDDSMEPTEQDLERMARIDSEIEGIRAELQRLVSHGNVQ